MEHNLAVCPNCNYIGGCRCVADEYNDFEVTSNVDDEFKCPICLSLLLNPVFTSCCRNTFCRICVKGMVKCPLCRNDLGQLSEPPRLILNVLAKTEVKCITCNNLLKREDMDSHREKVCPILCPFGCGVKITRSELKKHEDVCHNKPVKCNAFDVGCLFNGRRIELKEHMTTCQLIPQRPILKKLIECEMIITQLLKKDKERTETEQLLKERIIALENRCFHLEKHQPKQAALNTQDGIITMVIIKENKINQKTFQLKESDTVEKMLSGIREYDMERVGQRKVALKWDAVWIKETPIQLKKTLKEFKIDKGKYRITFRKVTKTGAASDYLLEVYPGN